MVWNLGASAAAPDGLDSLSRGATVHFGGQNFARYSNKRYDTIYERPYRFHVHRILTDLAWPWLIGYRRQLYSQAFWQYVDIDIAQQA